jgi:two-component system C4-dicarboxylate transport response regulator DctD
VSIILFADDEADLCLAAQQTFELQDQDIAVFSDATSLLKQVTKELEAVIVTDVRMPGMDGIELLEAVLEVDSELPVILLTGHGDVSMAVDCMRMGAYDFLEKPYAQEQLIATVNRALEKRRLTLEVRALRESLNANDKKTDGLIGNSAAITDLKSRMRTLAGLETDVLLFGETGTGKDTVAQLIHHMSDRSGAPFVHINCASIPSEMLEIELFGHEAGAFPSAVKSRYGKFEHARGGTVFLDAIESLSQQAQAKLLQAIEQRVVTPLGSNQTVELDIRIIAASQTDLRELVDAGTFRSDLYYRLAGAELRLPPLAERSEDIPRLFAEFVERAAFQHKRDVPVVPSALYTKLVSRKWPGNVRQLRTAAEQFVLQLDMGGSGTQKTDDEQTKSLGDMLADQEKAILVSTLSAHQGSLKATYESLGISRKMLYEKMQKFQLDKRDFLAD